MIYHSSDELTVYCADALDALPTLEPGSIDSVVTSPPYAMQRKSTYGGVPEADYPDWTVEWMRAIKPALTERGSVMLNISPHVKGGMLSDYVLRMRLALRADGWFEHDELAWVKPNAMPHGRPEVPVRGWESIFWYSLTPKPFSDAKRNGSIVMHQPSFHTSLASQERWGHKTLGSNKQTDRSRCKNFLIMSLSDPAGQWRHPARFQVKFADWMMKINTPDGGTVLDPFAGSGTTAVAAHSNGFRSVAIEREPDYARMIVERFKQSVA